MKEPITTFDAVKAKKQARFLKSKTRLVQIFIWQGMVTTLDVGVDAGDDASGSRRGFGFPSRPCFLTCRPARSFACARLCRAS